ncbi:hypothetical protein SDC9_200135 [bioreactor metagenome]|uniref:Uncharacterized protein n=1 Tax=bioreactor metagenome TaxID=1076179 RepID=A0A645IZ45_9ZZZZ
MARTFPPTLTSILLTPRACALLQTASTANPFATAPTSSCSAGSLKNTVKFCSSMIMSSTLVCSAASLSAFIGGSSAFSGFSMPCSRYCFHSFKTLPNAIFTLPCVSVCIRFEKMSRSIIFWSTDTGALHASLLSVFKFTMPSYS